MTSYPVSDIRPDSFFSADLYIDRQFLLLTAPCHLTEDMLKAVRTWGFKNILSEGKVGSFSEITAKEAPKNYSSETEIVSHDEFTDVNASLGKEAEKIKTLVQDAHSKKDNNEMTNKERIQLVQTVYDEFPIYIEKFYTRYATHKELNLLEISNVSKQLITFIQDYRRYVLRTNPSSKIGNKNFIVNHSMRSTVLAISIGLQLHMDMEKLVDLAVACLIHEIGMIRLPPYLYLTDRSLTHSERTQLLTHPIIGYNILKDANFPLSIQLAALEHHERENGTGYPQHVKGDKIPLYAKIIAVACSFEAITAPRTFKESRTTYEAMTELLTNENMQYDGTVLKALLFSLSLFPIGAYVYLSNGKIAQVTDVSPVSPKNPIVSLIGEKDEKGTPVSLQTNDTTLKIIRVMNKKEVADMLAELEHEEEDSAEEPNVN